MNTLGEVRLNHFYKADICALQTEFSAAGMRSVAPSGSGIRSYSWVTISGGAGNQFGQLQLGICHDDLYIRAFRNSHSAFYLPSYDGLKSQDRSVTNLTNCEDSYRALKVDNTTYRDSVGKETQAEINSRTFNRGELIANFSMLANKRADKKGSFYDAERRSLAYGCFIISEAIRFRDVRDQVQTLFDDDNANSRVRIGPILKRAQEWEKNTKAGNLGAIVTPHSAAEV